MGGSSSSSSSSSSSFRLEDFQVSVDALQGKNGSCEEAERTSPISWPATREEQEEEE